MLRGKLRRCKPDLARAKPADSIEGSDVNPVKQTS